jgi:hypothetical protein
MVAIDLGRSERADFLKIIKKQNAIWPSYVLLFLGLAADTVLAPSSMGRFKLLAGSALAEAAQAELSSFGVSAIASIITDGAAGATSATGAGSDARGSALMVPAITWEPRPTST